MKLFSLMEANKADTISLDVPLFIRLLEYAREDAKTDMDLHNVAEMAIKLSSSGTVLKMQQYKKLISMSSKRDIAEEVELNQGIKK